MTAHPPLLDVRDLRTHFHTPAGVVRAVDGVSFSIAPRQVLAVVGESGCGKSVTARSVMRLIQPPGRIESGEILYRRDGDIVDLAALDPGGKEIRAIRGNDIAMIFQEPMTSLNPVFTIGNQIMEGIRIHQGATKKEARRRAIDMLAAVSIPAPEQRVDEYPHQLSGGMRQRAMIAMALACGPALLIADEPTTALDVTIQAQVLELIRRMQREYEAAVLFITHDLGVVAEIADEVLVMYLGKIVEHGPVDEIFRNPQHPYTQGLLASVPSLTSRRTGRLPAIPGAVPAPLAVPRGCGFESRCPHARPQCREAPPELVAIGPGHSAACYLRSPSQA